MLLNAQVVLKKYLMKIYLTDADGFKAFSDVEYDGESYSLEEDSTGKSSSFYVMAGDNL